LNELVERPGGWFVHPSAYVDEPATIGEGTQIWHFCHVMSGARIGARCTLGQNVFVAAGVVIGDGVKIQNNVSLYEGVIVEDDVFLGPSCVLTNVKHPRAIVPREKRYQRTLLGRGCTIGANATIICGVVIGRNCVIGAGSVVTRDVPEGVTVTGVPARVVRSEFPQ